MKEVRQHYGADWWDYAACAGMDPELWFPGSGSPEIEQRRLKLAKVICGRCPVREECLVFAARTGQRFGVWGGLTPKERLYSRRCQRPAGGAG